MIVMETFASRLKQTRKSQKLTQGALAKLAGCSQASINGIEHGREKTSRHTIKLAHALRVNPFWLESGEGEMELLDSEAGYSKRVAHYDWLNISSLVHDGMDSDDKNHALYICPVPHSDKTFSTFLNHDRESIDSGSLLYVDPDAHVSSSVHVLVYFPVSRMVDVCIMISNGTKFLLRTLYASLDSEDQLSEVHLTPLSEFQSSGGGFMDEGIMDAVIVGRVVFIGMPLS